MEFINNIVGAIFGPLAALPPVLSVATFAIMITLTTTLFYRFLVNQTKVREIKAKIAELGKQSKDQTNPEQAKAAINEMLKLQNEQMRMNMKPMLPTLLLVMLIFPWFTSLFKGPIVQLPVSLPYFGADFGWLMWYFVVSIPVAQILRKLMGVE